jgi:hypothetical protein
MTAMRHGVLVAWLTASFPTEHSFLTFCQNLRRIARDPGTGSNGVSRRTFKPRTTERLAPPLISSLPSAH